MGISAGLGSLLGAVVSAGGAAASQASSAAASASLNHQTRKFNREEAEKARKWQANQDAINRLFNQREAAYQRDWAAKEALTQRDWEAQQAGITRSFNAQQSYLAQQFEERMSSTAHQREVADLKAAGLNPIISATGGSGAASPAVPVIGASNPTGASAGAGVAASGSRGSAAQAAAQSIGHFVRPNILGEFVHSALEGLKADNDLKRANAEDKNADAALKNADTNQKRQEQEASKIKEEIREIDSKIDVLYKELNIKSRLASEDIKVKHAAIDELISRVGVNEATASKVGLETQELERRIRYGSFLMTYLPAEVREEFGSHMLEFFRENKGVVNEFLEIHNNDHMTDKEKSSRIIGNIDYKIQNWLREKGYIDKDDYKE